MKFRETFSIVSGMAKKIVRNPRQIIRYLNPYKIERVFYYFRHGGIRQVSRILDDRLLMGADLKLEIKLIGDRKSEKLQDYPELFFDQENDPEVSVIIPVYNQFSYTYRCLSALKERTAGVKYEVLLADDCSNDLTVHISERVHGIRIIRNDHNLNFLKNCNHASQYAKGKYIVFLNNDTQVQDGWLEPLVELMDTDPGVGLTGSKLVYPDGTLQECGGILWNDGSAWNYGNGKNPAMPEYCYTKECDYISGAAIMVRRELWQSLKGFDEAYAPAYCEDSDLAFRVREAGFRVVVVPKSVVVHFEGRSNGTDLKSGTKAYQVVNTEKFRERWKEILQKDHFPNGEDVFLARDRGQFKKKILVIDHKVPMYDNDAGARTVFMYLKLFQEMGLQVTFIPDNYFPDQPYTQQLEAMGIEVLYGNHYLSYHSQWLEDNVRYFDWFMLNRPHISVKYIDIILEKRKPGSRLIYYGHDLHFLREEREYSLTKDPETLESAQKWRKIETELIRKADVSWVVGDYEMEQLQIMFPEKEFRVIPIFIYQPQNMPGPGSFAERKDLLFVGGFVHEPNIDAVKWFSEKVFPAVQKSIPDIAWNIVGSHPTEEIQALDGRSIHVLGYVTDEELESLYLKSRLVIVPLRFGAGVKGKVVEALYYQAPVLTTPIGAEGISREEGAFEVVEPDPAAFAEALVRLYKDEHRLTELSKNTRKLIENHYTKEQAFLAVRDDFKEVSEAG